MAEVFINTGRGRMPLDEAKLYFRTELKRVPTTDNPRDTSVLLGIFRGLPEFSQKMDAFLVIRSMMSRPSLFEFETAKTLVREARLVAYAPPNDEPSEMIDFGQLSRTELGKQCQYGSYYIHGKIKGYPNLAEGLRVTGDPFNYHSLRMHIDDVPTFVARYREHHKAQMQR